MKDSTIRDRMAGRFSIGIDSGHKGNAGAICDKLRRIWEMCEDKPEARALAEEAYIMAKKMDGKLRWYKKNGVWHPEKTDFFMDLGKKRKT